MKKRFILGILASWMSINSWASTCDGSRVSILNSTDHALFIVGVDPYKGKLDGMHIREKIPAHTQMDAHVYSASGTRGKALGYVDLLETDSGKSFFIHYDFEPEKKVCRAPIQDAVMHLGEISFHVTSQTSSPAQLLFTITAEPKVAPKLPPTTPAPAKQRLPAAESNSEPVAPNTTQGPSTSVTTTDPVTSEQAPRSQSAAAALPLTPSESEQNVAPAA